MRKTRKPLVGVVAVLALAVAFAVPAGAAATSADASGAPIAVDAKKKCKKKKKKKKKKCKKGSYLQGRYSGTYAEIPADMLFNVVGKRLYTGPFDAFFVSATCRNSSGIGSPVYTDVVRIEPVQASIDGNGDFAGSGSYATGSGRVIPWKISGHIRRGAITNGILTVGPYPDFAGDPCSGTSHFTAEWIGSYVL